MKRIIKNIFIIIILSSLLILTGCTNTNNKQENNKFKIVTSSYTMYILAMNIIEGANNVSLENMLDTNIGCFHNYTLTTSDLRKLEDADIFIQSGGEEFINKITTTYENLRIINSSQGLENKLIQNEDEVNMHIWTGIENYKKQSENITEELIKWNPENAQIYKNNYNNYLNKLNNLESNINKNAKSALLLSESLEYLLKDYEIEYEMIHTHHEESFLSATDLSEIIEKMKTNNIKTIIIDKSENSKNADLIANETGATIYKIDSCTIGELNKDAYIEAMSNNIKILNNIK